jgi:hypothetical protein
LIPVEDQSASYFLGPVGVSDPSEFIAAESHRIPFKTSLTKPHEWQDTLKNWPLPPIFLNREPWGKAPRQQASIFKKSRETSTYNRPNQRLGEQKKAKSEKGQPN